MNWVGLALIAFTFGFSLIGCEKKPEESPDEIILVRIPPYFDPKLTAGENQCVFGWWWHPPAARNVDIAKICKGAGLPNDGVPLIVSLHKDSSLSLNNEADGNISDVKPLVKRLSETFEERRINGAYEAGSEKIEKGVGLKIPATTKYADAFKVASAVKESGGDPIILLLDGHLPEQRISLPDKR